MSLSPICSIIKDFLAVITVSEAESDFVGTNVSGMCKDLGGTFLVFSLEGFVLLGKDEPLAFLTEDRGADTAAVEVEIGLDTLGVKFCCNLDTLGVEFCGNFDTLGVEFCGNFDTLGFEIWGVLVIGETDFFLDFDTFLSLLTGVTYTIQ